MTTLAMLSITQLAEGITLRAGRIAAAQAELLAWIAEFDRRDGWAQPGLLSCAHWLSWRTGLSPGAAREQVRVARRLEQLPTIAEALATGVMSYAQARAITRVAEPDDGIDWPVLARSSTAGQLERLVRGLRRAHRIADAERQPDRDPDLTAWKVRTRRHYDQDGNLVLTIITRPEFGPIIEAGLAAKRAEIDALQLAQSLEESRASETAPCGELVSAETSGRPVAPDEAPAAATDGDALLALAEDALSVERQAHPAIARRRRLQLTPRIDPISGWAQQSDGELLPPAHLRHVMAMRDGLLRLRPLCQADLRRHDLGRTSRLVSPALRDLLGGLDGERCRFPGCSRRKKLHAHHVRYWRDGGRTDLDNLLLLCSRHHTLVHAAGFRLTLRPDRRLDVHTDDGLRVLHHPAPPWGDPAELDPSHRISATTLPPDRVDRLDLHYAVAVLLQQAA